MLTDKPIDLDISKDTMNVIGETVLYDLSTLNIPLRSFKKFDTKKVNNAVPKNIDLYVDSQQIVKIPINVLPPPPYKMVNYNNNNNKKYSVRRESKFYDSYRAISPKGYDSDESCTSYSSKDSPSNGAKSGDIRNNMGHFGDQTTVVYGKYHSPTMYNNTNNHNHHHNDNTNYNKNRYNNTNIGNTNTANGTKTSSRLKQSHRTNTDVMIRRAHGLVERFKSRADIMRIDPNPPGLLVGTQWDTMNQAIWDVFSSKAQKAKTYEIKINVWKNIFLYIRKCLSSYGLFMVGSTMSGFGLESSDIDMCLLTKPSSHDPRLDSINHLNSVRNILVKHGLTCEHDLIMAKVPILKFKDKETGFEVDLNCNNSVGIRNTHLLNCYSRLDWRVRPLVIIVKLWAQNNNINDAKNMTISSYSWALMVIHFLQCGVTPPVLPCLHGLMPDKFNSNRENGSMDVQEDIGFMKDFKSDNNMCLGELLLGFLHYYTYFNYSQYAISVRHGCRLPIEDCRFVDAPKNDPNQWKCLCIQEPFDFTNTARSVFDMDKFRFIKEVIACSFRELDRTKMLNSILPVQLHQR